MRIDRPGAGHRLATTALAMGVPDVCPLEDTIPALIMILKHDRDVRMKDQIGRSQLATAVFGKGSMEGYLQVMYTPSELKSNFAKVEEEKEKASNMAMLARMKMLSASFQIQEIRE